MCYHGVLASSPETLPLNLALTTPFFLSMKGSSFMLVVLTLFLFYRPLWRGAAHTMHEKVLRNSELRGSPPFPLETNRKIQRPVYTYWSNPAELNRRLKN